MSHTVPVSCPQKSNSKTADRRRQAWTYRPGLFPELDAAVDQHASAHGTVWSPHLLGPDFISFADFIRRPELIALCPLGSDARFAVEELQSLDCFHGARDESKYALTDHIRESSLYEQRGSFRYVQRIFNSIWRNYEGLLEAKAANRKALLGAKSNSLRADERRIKETARKAAARSADPEVKAKVTSDRSERLLKQAQELRSLAEEKEKRAKALLVQAEVMRAKAAGKEGEALRSKQ